MGYRKNVAGIVVMALFMVALAFGIYFSLFWNRKIEGESDQNEMHLPGNIRSIDSRIEKTEIKKSVTNTPAEFLSQAVSMVTKTPTRELRFNIDSIVISDGYLTLNGWGYLQGMKSGSAKFYILMKSGHTPLAFTSEQTMRKDVTEYFKQSGLNLDSAGFIARIPLTGLEKGHYQLGLYLLQENEAGTGYSGKFADITK